MLVEERMYHEIYDAIIEYRLSPCTRLMGYALCKIYTIVRHAVRKVFSQLAVDGLVDLEPSRGALIVASSIDEACTMLELRQTLGRAVLDKVGHSSNPKATIALLMELVRQEYQVFVMQDRLRWIHLPVKFHVALVEQSGNPLVIEMMRRLMSCTTPMIANVEAPGNSVCSSDGHLDILNALERGGASAAQAHMVRHLQCCADRVRPETPANFGLRSVLDPRDGKDKV